MNYMIQMRTTLIGHPWELSLTLASDEIAEEYTIGVLQTDPACHTGAISLILLNLTKDTVIGTYVLDKPTARKL